MTKPRGVKSVAFSPDGKRIVSVGGAVRLWDAQTGEPIPIDTPLAESKDVSGLAFNPDGSRIVTVGSTLRLWNARSGQPIDTTFDEASGGVSVSFSPDGKRIVSADSYNTLRSWDVLTGEAIGLPIEKEDIGGGISTLVFSPDISRLVVNTSGGALQMFEMFDGWAESLCAKLGRNPTLKE